MKIIWAIHICDNPQTGGEKVVKRLLELLKSKDICIINAYRESKERIGIIKQIFINFKNFKLLIKQDREALIFQNLFDRPKFLLANILLRVFFKRKTILFIHEIYEIDHLSLIRKSYHVFVNHISFCLASLIVVNSKFTGNWVCCFGSFKKKLFLMYPAINLRAENLETPKQSQNSCVNILCLGNIRKNKGQIYLLHAIERIHRDFKITFVGVVKEKDYMERLKEFILKKGMSDKVIFTGFLSGQQLSNEFRKADIFVLPTLKEGFGMAVFEAMSFGLPVIVSKTGGILEQVTDGEEGFLVPPGDIKALADKLDQLIADTELRTRMGRFGRNRVTMIPTLDQSCDYFCQVAAILSQRE